LTFQQVEEDPAPVTWKSSASIRKNVPEAVTDGAEIPVAEARQISVVCPAVMAALAVVEVVVSWANPHESEIAKRTMNLSVLVIVLSPQN
jgi:hypothetical protein